MSRRIAFPLRLPKFFCFAVLATKLPAPSDAVGPARIEFTVTPVPATDSARLRATATWTV